MDPLTHTATGLFLSRAGLNRWTPLATPILLLAANAPDIDIGGVGGEEQDRSRQGSPPVQSGAAQEEAGGSVSERIHECGAGLSLPHICTGQEACATYQWMRIPNSICRGVL